MMGRISRNALMFEIVASVAKRSTCTRRQVGAVITLDGRILSLGYAGSPAGTPHCLTHGCIIGPDGGCIRTQHAEMNAIAWAARKGISLEGSTLYCSLMPCLMCAKLIINAGIVQVRAAEEYRDRSGMELLASVGIHWSSGEKDA